MKKPNTNCRRCEEPFTEGNPRTRRKDWCICVKCYNLYQLNWKKDNPDYRALWNARAKVVIPQYKEKYKTIVFNAYGNACSCCGETIREFLTIEHKNGRGGEHRRKRNFLGVLIDIIRAGFPPEYCLLCMNCNWVERKGKVCPHKLAKLQIVGPVEGKVA
jgi:hypothetical protein